MSASAPDLHGRVVVITGSNSGIGKQAAVGLAQMGAHVVLTSRSAPKGEKALAEVRRRAPQGTAELALLDLASFRSVRAFADRVLADHDRLDVLVNNAGSMLDHRLFTDEGFEMMFGVNHLGHFLLTGLLRDRLVATAETEGEARVVTVSSIAHRVASSGRLLADPNSDVGFTMFDAYARSKLANILFTFELARRLEGTGVTATTLHPGMIRSGFARDGDTGGTFALLVRLYQPFQTSPWRGAKTTVHLASSPEVKGVTGRYFWRRRAGTPSADARDPEAARQLWELSERLVAEATAPT
jgi:NAD(P)-dependent dehydrogenase (short-subunit alcohol dehydrogenase family)